jgi:hypothetical protein
MKFLDFYPTISDYFWSDFCYRKQLKFSIIPRFRVYLEKSRTYFYFKIEHSRQKLQADEVLYKNFIQQYLLQKCNFFHEIKRVEFRITISFLGWNSFFQLSKQNSTWLKDTRPHLF